MTNITITDVIDSLPGGFEADWTQDFWSWDDVYYTTGPNWAADIPDDATDAKKAAEEYSEQVREAVELARQFEREALEALRSGNLDEAKEAIDSASHQEDQYGDTPSYADAVELLAALIAQEEDVYTVTTTWGSFRIKADFSEASDTIHVDNGTGEFDPTPLQVADAQHSEYVAARLIIEHWGSDTWLSPDADITVDEEGEPLYNGLTEKDYIRKQIVSVESEYPSFKAASRAA